MTNIILGSILAVIGILLIIKKKKQFKNYQQTVGTIVEINRKRVHKSNGNISYDNIPIVEFEINKKIIQFENEVGGTSYTKTGVYVKVLFDINNPQKAYINNFWSLWLLEFIITLIGGLFLLSGIVLLLK